MLSEERITLSELRFEKARECLSDAALLAENGSYKSLANRSYYAVFHAIRAVLALDGFDRKKALRCDCRISETVYQKRNI